MALSSKVTRNDNLTRVLPVTRAKYFDFVLFFNNLSGNFSFYRGTNKLEL